MIHYYGNPAGRPFISGNPQSSHVYFAWDSDSELSYWVDPNDGRKVSNSKILPSMLVARTWVKVMPWYSNGDLALDEGL